MESEHSNDSLDLNGTTSGYMQYDVLTSIEYQAYKILNQYFFPIIIFGGVITNVLSILVLRRLPQAKCTLGFYFYIYCYMNLVTVTLQVAPSWIEVLSNPFVPLYYHQDWSCRLWKFIEVLVTYPSQWLMALLVLDLCLLIYWPDKACRTSTRFLAKAKITVVYTVLVFVNFYKTYTFMLTRDKHCVMSQVFVREPLFLVWEYVSAVINSYIPIIVVAVGVVVNFVGMLLVRISETAKCAEFYCATMALSTVFFLLSSPVTIINIVTYSLPREDYMELPHIAVKYQLANHVCIFVRHANLYTTFIVYVACIPEFFNELLIMLRWRRQVRDTSIEMDHETIVKETEKMICENEI